MAFESGIVPDWKTAVTLPLYKGTRERAESNNYMAIRLLSVVGKIYE